VVEVHSTAWTSRQRMVQKLSCILSLLITKQIQQVVRGLSSVSISRALMICILMITSGGKLDLCYNSSSCDF